MWTPECALALHQWQTLLFQEQGAPMGAFLSRKVGHHRRQPDGLGRCPRRSVCERGLQREPQLPSHKFPGALRVFCCPETLAPVPTGTSCLGSDRQHYDGGLNLSAGGRALPPFTFSVSQTDRLELRLFLVPLSNTCPGDIKYGGWELVPAPSGHGTDLGSIRSSIGGSVWVVGEHSVRAVLPAMHGRAPLEKDALCVCPPPPPTLPLCPE